MVFIDNCLAIIMLHVHCKMRSCKLLATMHKSIAIPNLILVAMLIVVILYMIMINFGYERHSLSYKPTQLINYYRTNYI